MVLIFTRCVAEGVPASYTLPVSLLPACIVNPATDSEAGLLSTFDLGVALRRGHYIIKEPINLYTGAMSGLCNGASA